MANLDNPLLTHALTHTMEHCCSRVLSFNLISKCQTVVIHFKVSDRERTTQQETN